MVENDKLSNYCIFIYNYEKDETTRVPGVYKFSELGKMKKKMQELRKVHIFPMETVYYNYAISKESKERKKESDKIRKRMAPQYKAIKIDRGMSWQ